MKVMKFLVPVLAGLLALSAPLEAQNKYIGVKMCGMCHKTDKQGKQFDIWQKSKHAEAYKTLTTAKADEFAKARGLTTAAAESPECLECHTPALHVDAKLVDKTYDPKDGVQCETCHGPGSTYRNMTLMKDKPKAIAAGMTDFKDEATIEKFCKTCHNERSPSYKPFKLDEYWSKIKHPLPKG